MPAVPRPYALCLNPPVRFWRKDLHAAIHASSARWALWLQELFWGCSFLE